MNMGFQAVQGQLVELSVCTAQIERWWGNCPAIALVFDGKFAIFGSRETSYLLYKGEDQVGLLTRFRRSIGTGMNRKGGNGDSIMCNYDSTVYTAHLPWLKYLRFTLLQIMAL